MNTVALFLVAFVGGSSNRPQSYAAAYRDFHEQGRPLVVLVGADWCPACRTMKSARIPEAFRRGTLADVSFAIVDVDETRSLANKLMRGNSIPQLIMFYKDEQGATKRVQLTGAQDAEQIQRFVGLAVQRPATPVATQPAALQQVPGTEIR